VTFGLARMPAHARRAEGSRARFEHFRNDGAEEAHRAVDGVRWSLVDRRDVSPESSNQWLLVYRKENTVPQPGALR